MQGEGRCAAAEADRGHVGIARNAAESGGGAAMNGFWAQRNPRERFLIVAAVLAAVMKVPLTLRFSSRFDQSIPFLYNVEDPTGKLVVEKFNITMSDPKSKTVDVEVQIALYTEAMPTTKSDEGA